MNMFILKITGKYKNNGSKGIKNTLINKNIFIRQQYEYVYLSLKVFFIALSKLNILYIKKFDGGK